MNTPFHDYLYCGVFTAAVVISWNYIGEYSVGVAFVGFMFSALCNASALCYAPLHCMLWVALSTACVVGLYIDIWLGTYMYIMFNLCVMWGNQEPERLQFED